MEILVERACGLDVHQATVVACVLAGEAGRKPTKEVRTFGTCLRDLEELRDWLTDRGVTHVGMGSTGVYWKPVYTVLEGSFELVVGNAHHIKNVPGRKTDAKDSEWIADLVRHGLIAKSFVPPKPIRVLRDLMRYRRKLLNSRSSERNRFFRLLETANIKVTSVATDVFGKSGIAMLEAIARGETSGETLAEFAKGRLRNKREKLAVALDGRVEQHHRFLLRLQLDRLRGFDASLRTLDECIDAKMDPYLTQQQALEEIPGVGVTTARALIAEIGVDMTVFKNEHHLAAWAGVCPGNHESAGKRLRGTARRGNVHVRSEPWSKPRSRPCGRRAATSGTSTTASRREEAASAPPSRSATRSSSPPTTSSRTADPTATSVVATSTRCTKSARRAAWCVGLRPWDFGCRSSPRQLER